MADQDIPAMDYEEHERTYSAFIEASKTGTVASIHVLLVILLLTSVATGLGMIVAVALSVAGVIASLIGLIAGKNGWYVTTAISFLMVLQLIFVYT